MSPEEPEPARPGASARPSAPPGAEVNGPGSGPSDVRSWIEAELDDAGVPRRLPVASWWAALTALIERWEPGTLPEALDRRLLAFARLAVRFTRPNGTSMLTSAGQGQGAPDPRLIVRWVGLLRDPAWETIAHWWLPRFARPSRRAPPASSWAATGLPLALMRMDWTRSGDWLAIDARDPSGGFGLELAGKAQVWLAPRWGWAPDAGPPSRVRGVVWHSVPQGDLAEWSFRRGTTRILRTAVLLRGRGLALLGEQAEGAEVATAHHLALPPGITAQREPEGPALRLTAGRRNARALGLGADLEPAAGQLIVRPRAAARRTWTPLLICWDPAQVRRPAFWRPLTVTEKGRPCPPERACAFRVALGPRESLLVYRSLDRPATRAFLGHQFEGRFLVGLFNREGNVSPLVQIPA